MTHTPGPWHVENYKVYDEHDEFIAVSTVDSDDTCEANARLIAAAPDLLAALQDLASWTQRLKDWSGADDPPIEAALAAIADAVGGAHATPPG